jgi:hypothetical protein
MVIVMEMVKMLLERFPSYTKEELVMRMASISSPGLSRSNNLFPLPKKKRTFAYAAASEKSLKITTFLFFPRRRTS